MRLISVYERPFSHETGYYQLELREVSMEEVFKTVIAKTGVVLKSFV